MDLAQLYRDIVETSPDGIWVVDLEGRTVYANAQIARIHGIPVEQADQLSVWDILDETGRVQFRAHLDQVRERGANDREVEVQWVRADGSVLWTLCSETVLEDAEGGTAALLHRYVDYTVRRSMIESLRASEEALEDQIAQNDLMQAIASAANEARSFDDVLRHARDLVILHDDWQRARAFVPEGVGAAATGRVVPFYAAEADREEDRDHPAAYAELALAQRSFDERRPVWDEDARLTVAFPVVLDDEVHAVIAITSDPPLYRHEMIEKMVLRVADQLARVVERERYQAELAAARDAAMEASRQKSEFLATMSHEIRTPLNGVIGLNELLGATELSPDQQRYVSGVQTAGRTLLDLINDILDFSKIEAGRLELEQVEVELRPLLENTAGLLAEQARDKGLDLVVSCHPDVPAVVTTDPTRLAQVVANLVSNAVKFTEQGGVILRATSVEAEDGSGDLRLRVEVSDTGVGIAAAKLAALFEPFTQADSSTTRVYGGTGLGLAISREIVAALGGELDYAPNLGGGSIFTFTARVGVASGLTDAAAVATPAGGPRLVLSGRRALLVDDTGADRQALHEHLAWWGVTVDVSTDLDDARAVLDAAGPAYDVVVLDLEQPRRDAAALAARVPDDVGVLLLASVDAVGDAVRTLDQAYDLDAVLVRPVLPAMLLAELRRLIEGHEPYAGPARLVGDHRGRILVVEDNPVNQLVATGLLGTLGFSSLVAEDGIAAIEAMVDRGQHFDAVLMDVQMPLMDGYTATRHLRGTAAGARIPIIAMTAAAVQGERERCLAAGMDDFLAKPVDAAQLSETLDRWLRPGLPPVAVTAPSSEGLDLGPLAAERLDLGRLAELRELDLGSAASYVERATGNFLGNGPDLLAEVERALAMGDTTTARSCVHKLAGSALNLGATQSGEAARALEVLIDVGDLTAAVAAYPDLAELLELDCQALREFRAALTQLPQLSS